MKFPLYGWCGILLIIVFWSLNWGLQGLRTHWGFSPLWLGYCLTIDALVYVRKGNSILTRSSAKFIMMFLISAPCWWLFELFNARLQNWHYQGREYFSDMEYFLLASLSFSTVMPAIFGSAELASTFRWIRHIRPGNFIIRPDRRTLFIFSLTGCLTMLIMLIWPEYFYPLVWASIYLILEPVNYLLGNKTLFDYSSKGDYRPVLSLWTGCLMCAFFWEMWNYYSYPKWVYYLPYFNFIHVFEMPVPGYIGYLPFSMELYALYNLITHNRRKERV